jgi:hypothetical protein
MCLLKSFSLFSLRIYSGGKNKRDSLDCFGKSRRSDGIGRWMLQGDGFFFVCSTLESYFDASGIAVAKVKYSPVSSHLMSPNAAAENFGRHF